MPSETITYQDASVKINASMFGGSPTVEVTCRNFHKVLTPQAFLELIYPAIDDAAKEA